MGKYSEAVRRVKNPSERARALQRSPLQRRALLRQGRRKRVTVTLEDGALEVRDGREKKRIQVEGLRDDGGSARLPARDSELAVLRKNADGKVVPVRVSLTTGEVKKLKRFGRPAELYGRLTSLTVVPTDHNGAPAYLVTTVDHGRYAVPSVVWAPLTPECDDAPVRVGKWHWAKVKELGLFSHPLDGWGRPVIMRGSEESGEFHLVYGKQMMAVKIGLLEALFASSAAAAEAEAAELVAAEAEEALRGARKAVTEAGVA